MIKRDNFWVIIIGLLISSSIYILIPYILEFIFNYSFEKHFRYPAVLYVQKWYLAVILSGIYIGISKANYKIINGIIVGMFHFIPLLLVIKILLTTKWSLI